MPKLSVGWWVCVAFMLVFELLATLFLDYNYDPMASIICIHAFPVVCIILILVFGPSDTPKKD